MSEVTAPPKARRTCRCGHDVTSPQVACEPRHTIGGMILLAVGISAEPIRLEYVCKTCGAILATVTDPAELKKHC